MARAIDKSQGCNVLCICFFGGQVGSPLGHKCDQTIDSQLGQPKSTPQDFGEFVAQGYNAFPSWLKLAYI